MGSILEGIALALQTSSCSCNGIAANLEHGEQFTCSKCRAVWYSRYKGYSPTLTWKK
jgi:hypothetical protein